MRVLLVDDDAIDRKIVKRSLADSGGMFFVTERDSVSGALDVLNSTEFDIVLLDYNLPDLKGIELLKEVRSQPGLGDTAIIMISATEEISIALNCIEAGAQDFISKSDITPSLITKSVLHAKKRFDIEKQMYSSYLLAKEMAEKDALTKLSNRYHFEESLKAMIASSKRANNNLALLNFDLDGFKHINDTYGHQAGDDVLVQVVERVQTCLRTNEAFARLGGDEFAIIIGNIFDTRSVGYIARRILSVFETPFVANNIKVFITASIGVTLYPLDAGNTQDLIKCADVAMYRAKQGGKNRILFYEPHFQEEFKRSFEIHTSLKRIVIDQLFHLNYQPIYCCMSKKICAFEALIRWPVDDGGFYTPDQFIPIAEETGMINDIGCWVLDSACQKLCAWREKFDPLLMISVNVSPVQLLEEDVVDRMISIVKKYDLPKDCIILEITETAFFKEHDTVRKSLSALSSEGFVIALDDFGTGFSSISHLINFPIDIVKLDKSVQTVSKDPKTEKVLESVVLMLKNLDFTVVAEGIETEEQEQRCTLIGVDRLQGYLKSRPLSDDAVDQLLGTMYSTL